MIRFVKTNLLIVFFISLFISAKASDNSVKDGYIDLTNYSWDNDVVNLEGKWDFYWHQLIIPKDANDQLEGLEKISINVPGPWTKVN